MHSLQVCKHNISKNCKYEMLPPHKERVSLFVNKCRYHGISVKTTSTKTHRNQDGATPYESTKSTKEHKKSRLCKAEHFARVARTRIVGFSRIF